MQNFEKSLTPATRARLKIYWHLFITAILTGALAGLGLIDQFQTIGLPQIIVAAVIGAILAFADGARKYMQASGETQKAVGVALAETLVAEKVPTSPKATTYGQELQQIAQSFISPVLPDVAPIVSSNPAIDNTAFETQDSLPNIAIVKAQFAKPVVPA
jgi:hypothetical protein